MMTRKQFEEVAAVLKKQATDAEALPKGSDVVAFRAISEVAFGLATLFRYENPRFDRDRFLRASGIID